MIKVVVVVEGGVVQNIVSDVYGVEVMIVDYDNEKEIGEAKRKYQQVDREPTIVQAYERGENP